MFRSLAYTSHTFRIWKAISIKAQSGLGKVLGNRNWDTLDTNIPDVNILYLVCFLFKKYRTIFRNGLNSAEKLDSHCTTLRLLIRPDPIGVFSVMRKTKRRK
jgi:hypothetical protein